MKKIILLTFVVLLCLASCKNEQEVFSTNDIVSFSKNLGFPESNLYFIKPEFQQQMLDMGQPNTLIFDKQFRTLKIGTCYEEYPFFMDEFFKVKSQLKDTLEMYDLKKEVNLGSIFSKIEPYNNNAMKIDSTKKYFHFYYFANYAKDMDAKLKPAIAKYQDSVQFFFINIDKRIDK
ncbi:hypothetical protein [Flavobacterium sp.]|uniref:hypothetical protein n=1 Tax=Flavobacterium sp. TaxID=239 RepID=UPI00262241C6|nr:hypothetical protein [Flavobacterium sp.]MDD3003733.1 hypothetical protein [Flavobacterium sp.]